MLRMEYADGCMDSGAVGGSGQLSPAGPPVQAFHPNPASYSTGGHLVRWCC
jgi:hypothetical protein